MRLVGTPAVIAFAHVCLLATGAAAARAQVSVVYGHPSALDRFERLASPMELRIEADQLRGLQSSKGVGLGDLGKYICEEVSISSFVVLISPGANGSRTYTFKGSLRVHSGVDQNVGLALFLYEGQSQILLAVEKAKISAEEGEDERFILRATVPRKNVKAIDEAKDLALQIVMTVKRD
jgi:hypothetical protein